jgi:hypothetical protein
MGALELLLHGKTHAGRFISDRENEPVGFVIPQVVHHTIMTDSMGG